MNGLAGLIEAVDAHQPADAGETTSIAEVAGLLRRFDDPGNRHRYDPGHLTASGFVVHPQLGAVALIHHEKLGRWLQPGGHVEPDDRSHEAAARREVFEECGISHLETIGIVDVDVHVFPARAEQPAHLHFDVRWGFVARTLDLTAGDGALGARWVPFEEAFTMGASIARPSRKLQSLAFDGRSGPGHSAQAPPANTD